MKKRPREIGRSLDERRLRRLIAVGRTLVSHLDLEAILEELLEVARRVGHGQRPLQQWTLARAD